MAKRKKPQPPADRKLRRLALAEWAPLTTHGNRQWCLVLERRPQSSKVTMWYGPDTVHNCDLRVVSLAEAASFQADWNNLPVLITELLVALTCARLRLKPDWLRTWLPFSVVIAGPERHDGQAPYQYWIYGRDAGHAVALVTAFHQATEATKDTVLVSVAGGFSKGGCWNDLRIGLAGRKVSLKEVQTVFQWHSNIARNTLPPGRPVVDKPGKPAELEEVTPAVAPEPV